MATERCTHPRRPVPLIYGLKDELPRLTPIVGDRICYESNSGYPIHRDEAMRLLLKRRPVFYTTWTEVELCDSSTTCGSESGSSLGSSAEPTPKPN